jgi:predicted Rossmann-fold nucleotide-binding protein
VCVGLLPGDDPDAAAPEVTLALATGMGEMRNALIARTCAGMIAIGGGHGTLSEIALALRLGRPVAALATWEVRPPYGGDDRGLHSCATPAEAVAWVLDAVRGARG